jgi:hypothetical protein
MPTLRDKGDTSSWLDSREVGRNRIAGPGLSPGPHLARAYRRFGCNNEEAYAVVMEPSMPLRWLGNFRTISNA